MQHEWLAATEKVREPKWKQSPAREPCLQRAWASKEAEEQRAEGFHVFIFIIFI